MQPLSDDPNEQHAIAVSEHITALHEQLEEALDQRARDAAFDILLMILDVYEAMLEHYGILNIDRGETMH